MVYAGLPEHQGIIMTYNGVRIKNQFRALIGFLLFTLFFLPAAPCLADLPATIDRVKPSIVGIGTVQKTRRLPYRIVGTGFVVTDRVREGEEYAFTGYPLGIIFELYPVTHRGII